MSVESDTVHYYAEIDRQERRDMAIERQAEAEASELNLTVYDWLTDRFGENLAIALTATPQDGYDDSDILEDVTDGRKAYRKWLDRESERLAIKSLEDWPCANSF